MSKKIKSQLSISPFPETLFVVVLDEYVLLTSFPITECIFEYYKFNNDTENAYEALDIIAIKTNKLVANAVDFSLEDPFIYDPKKIQAQMENLMKVISEARAKINGGLK
jgi:hypothetical protein